MEFYSSKPYYFIPYQYLSIDCEDGRELQEKAQSGIQFDGEGKAVIEDSRVIQALRERLDGLSEVREQPFSNQEIEQRQERLKKEKEEREQEREKEQEKEEFFNALRL